MFTFIEISIVFSSKMIRKIKLYLKNAALILFRLYQLIIHNLTWLRINFKGGMSNSLTCLNGKTAIVTGGNSGIGYMTSMLLASRGCKVIIACRSKAEKEREEIIKETNNPNITVKHLDLCRFSSVRKFADDIKQEESKIDILINNAGIGFTLDTLSEDGLDVIMQTNYLGHFLLTHLLIDLLKRVDDTRIVFLSSGLANASKLNVNSLYPVSSPTVDSRYFGYIDSKACNVLVSHEMSKKLAKYGIKVNAADPGVVLTPIFDVLEGPEEEKTFSRIFFGILRKLLTTGLFKSAQTSFHLAASRDIGSGLFYFRCEPMPLWSQLNDQKFCDDIWKETEKIVKLKSIEKLGNIDK